MKQARIDSATFDRLARETMRSTQLSLKAKCLLTILLSLPEDWKLNVKGLSSFCKEGKSAVQTVIKELVDCGYVKRVIVRNSSGKYIGSDYSVREALSVDFPDTEKPYAEKPYTEKPDTEKPDTEKQALQKDIISTKEKYPIEKKSKENKIIEKTTEALDGLLNNHDFSLCLKEYKASGKAAPLSDADLNEDLVALSKYPIEVAILIARQSISKGWRRLYYEKSAERINDTWLAKNGKGNESFISKNKAVLEKQISKYREDYE